MSSPTGFIPYDTQSVKYVTSIPSTPNPDFVYMLWDGVDSSKAVRYEFSDGELQSDGVVETTLANLGSAQSAGGARVVADANNSVIISENSLWLGKHRAVFVKSGDESFAAFNTQQIQSALNLGGIVEVFAGIANATVYVDASVNVVACLVHPSHSTLIIPNDITIKQAVNTKKPLIVSSACAEYLKGNVATVSLMWVSGNSFTVNWVGHNLSAGDYSSIFKANSTNTDPIQFSGNFRVESVTDANSFVCYMDRNTTVAPVATTWKALKSTVGCELIGGKWDFNLTNNLIATQTTDTMCMIYTFTACSKIDPFGFIDTKKYCIMLGCVRHVDIPKCYGISAGSDGIKVYGPAKDVRVGRITGTFHDDCISTQTYEADGFAGYRMTFGDISDVHCESINAKSTTAAAVVYTNAAGLGRTNNVTFGDISSNAPVKLMGQASMIGDVGYVNFGRIHPIKGATSAFASSNVFAEHIEMTLPVDMLNCSTNCVAVNGTTRIDKSTWHVEVDTTFAASSITFMQWDGDFSQLEIDGNFNTGSGTRFMAHPTTAVAAAAFRSIRFKPGFKAKGPARLVFIPNSPTVKTIVDFDGCDLSSVANCVESQCITMTPSVRAKNNNLAAVTNGFVYINTAGATVILKESDNFMNGSAIKYVASAGTVSTTWVE